MAWKRKFFHRRWRLRTFWFLACKPLCHAIVANHIVPCGTAHDCKALHCPVAAGRDPARMRPVQKEREMAAQHPHGILETADEIKAVNGIVLGLFTEGLAIWKL